jgi:hypothetical protein
MPPVTFTWMTPASCSGSNLRLNLGGRLVALGAIVGGVAFGLTLGLVFSIIMVVDARMMRVR